MYCLIVDGSCHYFILILITLPLAMHIPVFYQKQQNRLRKIFTFYSLVHVTQISWCTKTNWKCEIKIYFNFLLCKILRGLLPTMRVKWAAAAEHEIICCICCCYIYFLLNMTDLRVVWYSSLSNIDVQSLWFWYNLPSFYTHLFIATIFWKVWVFYCLLLKKNTPKNVINIWFCLLLSLNRLFNFINPFSRTLRIAVSQFIQSLCCFFLCFTTSWINMALTNTRLELLISPRNSHCFKKK